MGGFAGLLKGFPRRLPIFSLDEGILFLTITFGGMLLSSLDGDDNPTLKLLNELRSKVKFSVCPYTVAFTDSPFRELDVI